MRPNPCLISLLTLGLITSSTSSLGESAANTGLSRQLLIEKPLQHPDTAKKARVIRVEFPPGYKTPLHTHDAEGPRYVLKGHLRVEDNGNIQTYGPGDTFWETGSAMTIENTGGSDAEMLIFEVAP